MSTSKWLGSCQQLFFTSMTIFFAGVLLSAGSWAQTPTSRPTTFPQTPASNRIVPSSRTAPSSDKSARTTPIPVWIDADPAVGEMGRDVDDGFALLQAFRSKELAVRGVSVVFGNAALKRAYPITQRILKLLKVRGIPVVSGAKSHKERGKPTPASNALANALRKEKLTLLVLGPATNIATVLQQEPTLAKQIVQIISVAGRRIGQKFLTGKAKTPHRDYNFECDPAAYKVLLQSQIPLVFAPWEISSKLWLRNKDLQQLEKAHALGKWLAPAAKVWLFFWKRLFGVDGFHPFDTLAISYLTSPALLACQQLPMKIIRAPNDTPHKPFLGNITSHKLYLVVDPSDKSARSVTYCHTPKAGLHADLMRRLLAPAP